MPYLNQYKHFYLLYINTEDDGARKKKKKNSKALKNKQKSYYYLISYCLNNNNKKVIFKKHSGVVLRPKQMTVVHLSNQQKLLHVYAGTLVYKKYADTKIELYVFFKIFLILFHKRFLRNIFQVVLVLCHGKISFAVQFFYSILCQILTIHGKTK